MKPTVDLNCDMGEGMANEESIMPLISSVNIACGEHAGNPSIIKKTVALARKFGVAVGAHPSYPDRIHFGRVSLEMSEQEIYTCVIQQLSLINEIASDMGVRLHHVKPHGALYNDAATNPKIAAAIYSAIEDFDTSLIVYGLANSICEEIAYKKGLRFYNEVFADRTYTEKGLLTPRTSPNALIENDKDAVRQVLHILQHKSVVSTTGKAVPVKADTICIHGDGSHAFECAQSLRKAIESIQIHIQS